MHRSARRMIHRWSPVRAAAAALAVALLAAPVWAQGKSEEKLPSAEALLAKMVTAMGGEATIRKHRHQTLKGEFEMPAQGIAASMTVHAAAPNLRLVTIEVPGFGSIANGFDGTVAWRNGPPAGPEVLAGAQREQAVQQADFYTTLNYPKNFQSIDVLGVVEFNGASCYELKMTSKDGDEQRLYISADTHRVAGSRRTLVTPQGDIEATAYIEGYTEHDGQQVATKTRVDFGGFQEQIVTFTEISFEEFDHSVFDLPEPIKALVKPAAPSN